jgi:hypothetical protein
MSKDQEKEIQSNLNEDNKSQTDPVNNEEGQKEVRPKAKADKNGSTKREQKNAGDVHKIAKPTNEVRPSGAETKNEDFFDFFTGSESCDSISKEMDKSQKVGQNQIPTTHFGIQDNELPKKLPDTKFDLSSKKKAESKDNECKITFLGNPAKRKTKETPKSNMAKKLVKQKKEKKALRHSERTFLLKDYRYDMITPKINPIYTIGNLQDYAFSLLWVPSNDEHPNDNEWDKLTPEALSIIANIHTNHERVNDRLAHYNDNEGDELSPEALSIIANVHHNHERVNDRLDPYVNQHLLYSNYSTVSTNNTTYNNLNN